MEWKNIVGYDKYQISDSGIVKSYDKRLKFGNNGRGYLFVNLSLNSKTKQFYIHRLVATHFIPNPQNKKEVNHIDGNKSNNCIENLEWVSRKENIEHAIRTGLRKQTEQTRIKQSLSKIGKLNPNHRRVICVETGMIFETVKEASNYLGFWKTAVSNALKSGGKSGGYHFKYYD